MDEQLWTRFENHERRALARLLSMAAQGKYRGEMLTRLGTPNERSRVIALTGSGGVGKSTMIGRLLVAMRAAGETVAVLACDPQSPLSGGALLGDRFRMAKPAEDDGVFIRSLAALSGHSALADHLDVMIRLLEAFGFRNVIIETVGAGQGDTAVRDLADVVVLLLQPEAGDDLQWEKAGVLEVADVLALNKCDLPGADDVFAQIRNAMQLTDGFDAPLLAVSGKTGAGVDELWQAIRDCRLKRADDDADVRELARLAHAALQSQFDAAEQSPNAELTRIVERWKRGELPEEQAGPAVLTALCSAYGAE